jgi:hypothetical protein
MCKKLIFVSISAALLFSACGGGDSKPKGDKGDRSIQGFPAESLYLDYNLPLSTLGLTAQDISGVSFNYEDDYYVVLSQSGELIALDPAAQIIQTEQLVAPSNEIWTDIAYAGSGDFLVSAQAGTIYRLNIQANTLIEAFDLSNHIDSLHSLSYNPFTEETIAISDSPNKLLFSIDNAGDYIYTELDPRFEAYSITGLDLGESGIYVSAIAKPDASSDGSFVIQLSHELIFETAWSLSDVDVSGVAVLNEQVPEFVVTNGLEDAALKFYEPEFVASVPQFTTLEVLDEIELDFDQPSGIHFHSNNNTLYYSTDFGEIRRGQIDGVNELLFEIETQQGSFEAITASGSDNILLSVLKSDESSDSAVIEVFEEGGTFVESITIEKLDENHVFESIDINEVTSTYYSINSQQGTRKYIYQILDGSTVTMELPSSLDAYVISGLTHIEDLELLYILTEEYYEGDVKYAGLLLKYDLIHDEIMDTRSVIQPESEEMGLIDPSGVSYNAMTNQLYITSDVDDSSLSVFVAP